MVMVIQLYLATCDQPMKFLVDHGPGDCLTIEVREVALATNDGSETIVAALVR